MNKKGNINFVLIGAKATGKTVYLASLYLNVKSVSAKDGHTIEYLKPLANNMLSGSYPQATSGGLYELLFNYKSDNFSCSMQIDDVDGYFVETMHKKDENTQTQRDKLIHNIKNSEGIIFFFPYEENFDEESIKNFNYEIDTFLNALKSMYKDKDIIPVPAIIAVSKWDKSPDFKKEDEQSKALEYINNNYFLKLAKETIEQFFQYSKILPISATSGNLGNMAPYNLEEPIEYFLEIVYDIWENKIKKIQNDKEKLLGYLSRIYFDMKFYKNGKYNDMYDALEKEYSRELIEKCSDIKNINDFIKLKEEYKNIIPFLTLESKEKLDNIEKKLKTKKLKIISMSVIVVVFIISLAGFYLFKINKDNSKKELFKEIVIKYNKNNYKETLSSIKIFETKYKSIENIDEKKKIEGVKQNISMHYKNKLDDILKLASLEKQYQKIKALYEDVKDIEDNRDKSVIEAKYTNIKKLYSDYQKTVSFSGDDMSSINDISVMLNNLAQNSYSEIPSLRENFKISLISLANNIISNTELDNVDGIDTLLNAFTTIGINEEEITTKLTNKRNVVEIKIAFDNLMREITDKNFDDSLESTQKLWKEKFTEQDKNMVKKILNRKFNKSVEDILKNLQKFINDIDSYNELDKGLKRINGIMSNMILPKLNYKPMLDVNNKQMMEEKEKQRRHIKNMLHEGVQPSKIYFIAKKDNEPLGFKCDGVVDGNDLVLTIDGVTYSYETDMLNCVDHTMSWYAKQRLKNGSLEILAIEKDTIGDDTYNTEGFLTKNDIFKLENKEYFEIEIGKGYKLGFGE